MLVTCVSPPAPLWKSTISEIASPSEASEPISASPPAVRRPPATARISGGAAGSQISSESISASALQEEVEADAGDAHQHQAGIDAQHAALRLAPPRRAGAHQPGAAADQHAVDEDALERVLREAPEPGAGADDEHVDQLVEIVRAECNRRE